MSFEIRKKRKYTKTEEFVKKIKEIYEKAKVALKKLQDEIKIYIDRNRKEAVEYKMGDRVLLSTKDLTQQIRNKETKKLTEKFIGPYKIKKIILENAIKLELPALMKIHLVVHIYRIVLYQKCYNSNSLLKLEFKKKPCIRINTRELDRKLCIESSI